MWTKDAGLRFDPFDRAVTMADLQDTRDVAEVHEVIRTAVENRGFVFIIGPAGAGKSTAVDSLIGSGDEQLLVMRNDITLNIEGLTISQIEDALIREICMRTRQSEPVRHSEKGRLEQLRRLLGEYQIDHNVVLVFEDGHVMKTQTLINVKRLRELRFRTQGDPLGQERLLTVIVLAQPTMRHKLRDIPEVDMRSDVFELSGLDSREVKKYITDRVENAYGKMADLFTAEAMDLLADRLRWPGQINDVVRDLLRDAAYLAELPVTADFARQYVSAKRKLLALWLSSGLGVHDVITLLKQRGLGDIPGASVKRALYGEGHDEFLTVALMQVLSPLAGEDDVSVDVLPQIADEQDRLLYKKIVQQATRQGINLDWNKLAEQSKMTLVRLQQLMRGEDVSREELAKVAKVLNRKAA